MINKYIYRSKISEAKFRQLVSYFVLNLSATQMAQLSGLNRTTVNRIVDGIRGVIKDRLVTEHQLYLIPDYITVSEKLPCGIVLIENYIHLCVNTHFEDKSIPLCSSPTLPHFLYDLSTSSFIKIDSHLNDIEQGIIFSFIQSVKYHQQMCFGIPEKKVVFHMSELVFRFNYRNENKYDILLKWLRENPIQSPRRA